VEMEVVKGEGEREVVVMGQATHGHEAK